MISACSQHPHPTDRDVIVRLYRHRIHDRQRSKLDKTERQTLAIILRDQLIQMANTGTDTSEAIESLCQEELNLLEEGYLRATLKSSYLPAYLRLIREAITSGALLLTEQNSYLENGSRRHYALDFLSYKPHSPEVSPCTIANTSEVNAADTPPPAEHSIPVELNQYRNTCQALIASKEPTEIVAGLAAATGRDYQEVLAFSYFGVTQDGRFNRITLQKHAYLLRFVPSHEPSSEIDILTILPAVDVLAAIHKLRGQSEVAELERAPVDTPASQAFFATVDHAVYTSLTPMGIVPTVPREKPISLLRELYLTLVVHYFDPQLAAHRFSHAYLDHLIACDHWIPGRAYRYRLTHNQTPLSTRGVLISSQGPLPMSSNPEDSTTDDDSHQRLEDRLPERSPHSTDNCRTADASPISMSAIPRSPEEKWQDPVLIESLLTVLKQQSQTITALSETITQLRTDLATAQQCQATHPVDHVMFQALERSLDDSRAKQGQLHSLLEDYRARWQQIRQVANFAEPSTDTLLPAKSTKSKRSRPPKEKARKPKTDPQQANVYRRAVRAWQLTQDWNQNHDYKPESAIQLSKSLLARCFSVHAKAIKQFWTDFAAEIQIENERLGLNGINVHFNKGAKIETYITHVKTILENEGFYV